MYTHDTVNLIKYVIKANTNDSLKPKQVEKLQLLLRELPKESYIEKDYWMALSDVVSYARRELSKPVKRRQFTEITSLAQHILTFDITTVGGLSIERQFV